MLTSILCKKRDYKQIFIVSNSQKFNFPLHGISFSRCAFSNTKLYSPQLSSAKCLFLSFSKSCLCQETWQKTASLKMRLFLEHKRISIWNSLFRKISQFSCIQTSRMCKHSWWHSRTSFLMTRAPFQITPFKVWWRIVFLISMVFFPETTSSANGCFNEMAFRLYFWYLCYYFCQLSSNLLT